SNTIKYDLVFIEELLFPCYYGLVHHLGSPPVIAIAPALFFCSQVGDYASPENPSYVPSVLLPYTDSMSFLERLQNTLFFLFARTSLIFNYPVPLPPSIVTFRNEINQMMLDPLPKDLQRFLDDAPNGIIYLSFGSNVHSARMPKDKIYVFLDVFSELPQKVLWKWESDVLPAETSKVKFDKWFPQPEDHPDNGIEKAVWWTEYVLRHKGAKHLQSARKDLDWHQYLLLDVLASIIFAIIIMLYRSFWLLLLISYNESAKILGIFPMPAYSHQALYQNIMKALVARGHEVTVIGTNPLQVTIANYTDIDISFSYKFHKDEHNFEDMIHQKTIDFLHSQIILQPAIADLQLSSPQLQEFIRSNKIKYDLVIFEEILFASYYGLVHHVGSPPVIGITPFQYYWTQSIEFAASENPSYVPNLLFPYTDNMSFFERLQNTVTLLYLRYVLYSRVISENERVMRKHFGVAPPSITEAINNKSLFLIGSNWAFSYIHPLPPSAIRFQNAIIKKVLEPLPKDLQEFLDDAPNGAIYVSFGSNVHSARMPKKKIQAFLDAFAQLPQKVLWKWESDRPPSASINIRFQKWFPQQEILAHKNMKLFITHCGLQSLQEAVYNAVPIVAIPFFADQIFNAKKVEREKIGVQMSILHLTKDGLLNSINKIFNDSRNNAKRFSSLTRDELHSGIENVVWWTEYVLRHNGAKHLKTGATNLNSIQYFLLDILAFIVFSIALITICFFFFMFQHSFLLLLFLSCANAAKILGIFPIPSFSHQKLYQNIMKALVAKGHEVTVIGTDPLKEPIENYTEVDISFAYKLHKNENNFEDMVDQTPYEFLYSQVSVHPKLADNQLSSPQLQGFLRSNKIKYDLVLLEELFSPCYHGLVHHLGSPTVIAISPIQYFVTQPNYLALLENPSYVPSLLFPFSDSMSFLERLQNTFFLFYARYMVYTVLYPENEKVMRKHFGTAPPSIIEAMNNKSLFLVGTSWMFNYPLALPPSAVTFHNANIKTALDPLPKFRKWLPQQEILAHKNTKLFITHCGLHSLQEAVYYAVPMLVFPFFGDQPLNAKKVHTKKIGLQMSIHDISKDALLNAINKIYNDSRHNAKMYSALAKDTLHGGVEKAVWWTEYVLRHKGARHLRSAALDMNWYQYLLLDVIIFLILSASIILFFFSFIIYKIFRYFSRNNNLI
ncbi:hypothetical protein C0J52_20368, partial [Blattella germanica]